MVGFLPKEELVLSELPKERSTTFAKRFLEESRKAEQGKGEGGSSFHQLKLTKIDIFSSISLFQKPFLYRNSETYCLFLEQFYLNITLKLLLGLQCNEFATICYMITICWNLHREIFFNKETEKLFRQNEIMHRPQLGETLEIIASEGMENFATGTLMKNMMADLEDIGGYHLGKSDFQLCKCLLKELNHETNFHTSQGIVCLLLLVVVFFFFFVLFFIKNYDIQFQS